MDGKYIMHYLELNNLHMVVFLHNMNKLGLNLTVKATSFSTFSLQKKNGTLNYYSQNK